MNDRLIFKAFQNKKTDYRKSFFYNFAVTICSLIIPLCNGILPICFHITEKCSNNDLFGILKNKITDYNNIYVT